MQFGLPMTRILSPGAGEATDALAELGTGPRRVGAPCGALVAAAEPAPLVRISIAHRERDRGEEHKLQEHEKHTRHVRLDGRARQSPWCSQSWQVSAELAGVGGPEVCTQGMTGP